MSSLPACDWPASTPVFCARPPATRVPRLCALRRGFLGDCLLTRVRPRERACVPDLQVAFYDVCSPSLPGPGVPVRTPRRPCARLPKTSASPGPPRRQGTAKCHLDPLQSGERRTGGGGGGGQREGGDGELNERETKVKEGDAKTRRLRLIG